jgi:hypothetical protein
MDGTGQGFEFMSDQDLAIRPIFHQKIERIEAHIFVAFLGENSRNGNLCTLVCQTSLRTARRGKDHD